MAGAKTLVVIRTVPSQMYYTPQWFKRMERWLGDSSLQPLVNLVQHHETAIVTFSNLLRNHRASCGYSNLSTETITCIALGSRIPAAA